ETCGCVADVQKVSGQVTLWCTTQAPHAHRTVYALVTGLPEHKIRIIAPDIGGGFGNKVPIYPGYVCAIVASLVIGKPVKWMEDRTENLVSTGFARDYIMRGEIAASKDGKIRAIRTSVLADHGAFNGVASPVKYPAGFFGVFTGSYDIEAAYAHMTAVYTNKAPGGVAYACSFRITEAVYLVERMVDVLAYELDTDPAELRLKNFIAPEQFPYESKTGWIYDSGDYEPAMRKAMDMIGYDELRQEQAEKRERGELMGIGISFFTEAVGAGPRKDMDILGLGMADGCELRIHPTGKAVVRLSVQTQGQGHETTFAQIISHELGIPPEDIDVVHGDTDNTPFGLGTYGSRSTPVSGAAASLVARKIRDKAQIIASGMLEASVADVEYESGEFRVKGDPEKSVTIQDVAMRAHGAGDLPDGIEGGLDAQVCYNPSNLTYPFGAYICVVDIDPGTAQVKVRRFVAVDDCGTQINPMIIEGQVHGGLTDGVGMALMEMISFDEAGNCLAGSLMDYLIPTAMEVPDWETGHTVTPSPHHPIGAKGIGESATVGSPPAIVNAVVDALKPYGVRHADMPLTPSRVWETMQGNHTPPI
ncbi:MAG: carbon-monoxide dehydrogenase large subunit, partial [Actinobacteria bacterium]|nr:carbon-monoxide dehydrogenase large subunit [Actinomycetota bacterium]